MDRDSLIHKLTSRKFWCAIAGFIATLLTALNVNSLTIEQAVTIISAVGILVAYIWGESKIDASREGGEIIINKGTEVTHIYGTDELTEAEDDKPPGMAE